MKISSALAVVALVVPASLIAGAPSAQAAASCSTGIVRSPGPSGDRAFGSCSSYDRASQQARVTADCILGPDRNTRWFHDNQLHYTGYCGTVGVTNNARSAFVSFRG